MSLLEIEQKMWKEKATEKNKKGPSKTNIVAKYHSREKRIMTEINREKLPSFAEALKKPGYMNLQPFYQRRSRWDKQKQSRLIESFIVNIPIPPIILYEQNYNSYEVIDGQQRITAIRDFYENKLKLTGLEFWSELNGLTYEELHEVIQAGIDRRSISTITIVTESTADPEEAMLLKQLAFERINTGGVDLSRQEARHCLYNGKFDELLLELSRHPIFAEAWGIHPQNDSSDNELAKNNLYKKMEDAELVLRFFALRNMEYFRGTIANFLDLYMRKSMRFDDKDIESLKKIFLETIKLASKLYEENLFKPLIIGLFNGTKGKNKNYKLLQQAFLLHNQNLRKDVLEKLFADAGINDAWQWVIKHREVINFTRQIEESKNNYEKELNQLISYRNEAAHGAVDVDEILFTPQLLNLGNFIKSLCPALAELVTYEIFKKQTDTGKAKEIGKVTEWYEKSKAVVAKINNSNLSIGTNVLLVKETSSDCRLARIESIKVNNTPLESIEITNKIEVGLKFDIDAKKELKIYIVVEDSG